jgi:hypothetical protein
VRLSRAFQGSRRRRPWLLYVLHLLLRNIFPQADAASARRAKGAWIDQFDTRSLKSRNELHQRIDVSADDAIARFHPLNGGDREVRHFGRLPLIDVQERAGGPELIGGNHERAASGAMSTEFIYILRIFVSTINLHAQDINSQHSTRELDRGAIIGKPAKLKQPVSH